MSFIRALGWLLVAMLFIRLAGSRYMPALINQVARTGNVFFKGTRPIWSSV